MKTKEEWAMGNRITIDGGKYTLVNELNEGGGLKALRYGEEWRDLTGDGLMLAMYHEIERMQEFIEARPTYCIECGDQFRPDFAFEDGLLLCEGCGGYC